MITECAYIILVLAGGGLVSFLSKNKSADLKGLNLPAGSIRAMLSLIVVGSFVIFLTLGHQAENFEAVVSAFGTLTGAVVGFYFAHRGAEKTEQIN